MSHPNPDRDERVRQIQGRFGTSAATWEDVGYLLSLLDSQAAEDAKEETPSECFDRGYMGGSLQGHADGYELGYHDAATRMRDACVEKVRELRDEWDRDGALLRTMSLTVKSLAADQIITALQSLTLDVEV